MSAINDLQLVWGSPGDIEQVSDGGGQYASAFKLTPHGIAKVAQALGVEEFRFAEFCPCPEPKRADLHVDGEPSDTICLASPITPNHSETNR